MNVQIVILAAGSGTRMRSTLPKVLHRLAGKPLLQHVYESARPLLPEHEQPILVYGHQGEQLKRAFEQWPILWVHQEQRLGTGHAVQQALPHIKEHHRVLILYGDVPLLNTSSLQTFLANTPEHAIGILTTRLETPHGYGRIIRDAKGQVVKIIEEKDASEDERAIREINSGIVCIPSDLLHRYLSQLTNNNKQGEFYLTDVIGLATQEGQAVAAFCLPDPHICLGINTRTELARMERLVQHHHARFWMEQGVHLADPDRFDIRGTAHIGEDTFIDFNVLLMGNVQIGRHCHIEPNVILHDVVLDDYVRIRANSIVEGARIGSESIVGPFARIRPGTELAPDAHIGNFVELKQAKIGSGSKIGHLSYIGDCVMGEHVNVGAGAITCNYDGANKHQTVIEDDVFIGSDTQLIAPVTIKKGATIAAGSTVTKDVESYSLALTHTLNQRVKSDWKRPSKESTSDEKK